MFLAISDMINTKRIGEMRDEIADLRANTDELIDILNPSSDAEYVEEHEDARTIAEELNEDMELRIARIKDEMAAKIADTRPDTPKSTPYITPLHPEIYNIHPDADQFPPNTSHTVEYVE